MENLSYKNSPSIYEIKEKLISQAVLDIILTEEENHWLRLINFYKNYSNGIDMVKIDNGAGDHVCILFSDEGAIIKGFITSLYYRLMQMMKEKLQKEFMSLFQMS